MRTALTLVFVTMICVHANAALVISEIMQNPDAASDTDGEWFEVFNSGPNSIDLNGYTFADLDTDSFTVDVSLIAHPGDYVVLGRNSGTDTNGGVIVDFEYSSWALANGGDEIIITDPSDVEVDRVVYDGGPNFPAPVGASMFLTGSDASIDNNVGSNWVISTTPYGDGDLGTPGSGSLSAIPEPSAFLFVGMAATVVLAVRRKSRLSRDR